MQMTVVTIISTIIGIIIFSLYNKRTNDKIIASEIAVDQEQKEAAINVEKHIQETNTINLLNELHSKHTGHSASNA